MVIADLTGGEAEVVINLVGGESEEGSSRATKLKGSSCGHRSEPSQGAFF